MSFRNHPPTQLLNSLTMRSAAAAVVVFCLCIIPSHSGTRYDISTVTQSFIWPDLPAQIVQKRHMIQVSVILPFNHSYSVLEPQHSRSGAGILAGFLDAEKRGLSSDFIFNVTFRDSKCDNTYGPKSFTDAIVDGVDILFGPSCDYALAVVARMIKFYNLPLITAGGFVFDFNKPKLKFEDEFHLLVKTGYSFEPMAKFIFDFFNQTGWKRTTLAYRKNDHSNWSGNNTCTSFMSTVVKIARQRNISFDEIKLDSTDKLYPGDSKAMLQDEMEDYSVVVEA